MENPNIVLSDKEFDKIRNLVFDVVGIHLNDSKKGLVVSRLQKIIKDRNLSTFDEYYDLVKNDKQGKVLIEFVNRITTNFTYFYREEKHFDFFKDIALPEMEKKLNARGSKDLRVWCAGCSSGEEPYTLMMLMKEYFGGKYAAWDAGILATDVSLNALTFARKAVYPSERLQNLPPHLKNKYFSKIGDDYCIIPDLVREVTYRRFNLMNEVFPFKQKFQMIFCRNVMIYFNQETRKKLVKNFIDFLEPGGYLFIGHSETLGQDTMGLKYIMPALYQKEMT